MLTTRALLRAGLSCSLAALTLGYPRLSAGQQSGAVAPASSTTVKTPQGTGRAASSTVAPTSNEDKANLLSDQIGKLMVKCVNLLTAQDPLSLDYCKQQRDLADQYPPHLRVVDKMMAHDEYGIALAAFDHKKEALAEFDVEVALVPKAVKPGSEEWSTAYWHRAMIHQELGELEKADRDYRAAEENFRKAERIRRTPATGKMRTILRQHAALLQKEGKTDAAHRLLEEAAK